MSGFVTTLTRFSGQTMTIGLIHSAAAVEDTGKIVCKARALPRGKFVLPEDAPAGVVFTPSFRATEGDVAKGWDFTLAAATDNLTPGNYQLDAFKVDGAVKLPLGGGPIMLTIKEAASL